MTTMSSNKQKMEAGTKMIRQRVKGKSRKARDMVSR